MIKALLALLLACVSAAASAQSFPNRPVRIMVGSAAGGGTDIVSRLLAAKLQEFVGPAGGGREPHRRERLDRRRLRRQERARRPHGA